MTNNIPLAIDVQHFKKSFGQVVAVQDLTLKIKQGTIFGFLGANGSGKTTSIRMLSGLTLPDKGTGTCLGLDLLTQTKLIQAQLGYMPQAFSLYRNLTLYENLDFIARIYNTPKQRIAEIIELFSFQKYLTRPSKELSGGWQQKLSLAAAILHKPKILLLDEPTTGIDPASRILIWEQIQNLAKQKVTILLSTHLIDEAERCSQLIYMSFGKILSNGSVNHLVNELQLKTWKIIGDNLPEVIPLLKKCTGSTAQVIEKGHEIRISTLNEEIIHQLRLKLHNCYELQQTPTTLEDVFIYKIQHEEPL